MEFLDAYNIFRQDLHRVLIYDMPLRNKYICVLQNDHRSRDIYVYVQSGTDSLVKVTVNGSLVSSRYGLDPIDIFAEDATMQTLLESLPSVVTMRLKMKECLEIVYEDQVLAKLKYKHMSSVFDNRGT